jgi:ferrous iron transport protein B
LNYTHIAQKKHIHIDQSKLAEILGFPGINTIAIKGIGVHELVDAALEIIQSSGANSRTTVKYGPEIENRLQRLVRSLEEVGEKEHSRWTALKLLEQGNDISLDIESRYPEIGSLSNKLAGELESIHGEDTSTVIASER